MTFCVLPTATPLPITGLLLRSKFSLLKVDPFVEEGKVETIRAVSTETVSVHLNTNFVQ